MLALSRWAMYSTTSSGERRTHSSALSRRIAVRISKIRRLHVSGQAAFEAGSEAVFQTGDRARRRSLEMTSCLPLW